MRADANARGGRRGLNAEPHTNASERADGESIDRWRGRSPTRDNCGGMGAPHECTSDNSALSAFKAAIAGIVFSAAFADDGSDEPKQPKRRRSARIKPGTPFGRGWRGIAAVACTLALLAALGVGAYAARVIYDVRLYDDTFYPGIYLDEVELKGMTLAEAEQAVNELNQKRIDAVCLSVEYGDEVFSIDSSGLKAQIDTREQLDELWQLGREGDYAARHSQIVSIAGNNVHRQTTVSYSETALDDFLSGIKSDVDKSPKDATIKFSPNESEKFKIGESASGREVDLTALKADARAAIDSGDGRLELTPKRLEPDFTTADARACTGKLVTYSTQIRSSNSARTANIKLALGFYHGLRVEPGQQVDFNKLVGNRTEARGFKAAPEYSNGEIVEGVGGGVCQASTTLYGALLRTGMRIDERYNHSMTVGYVPKSQDAAVVYPGKTLSFTNTTGYPAFFTTRVTSDTAMVTIYGYDMYPGKSIDIQSEVLSVDEAKINTYADPTYQYTTELGQIVTVTTPSDGVTSRAYRVITDDATGKVVSKEQLSRDTYRRRDGVRYRGGE